MVAHEPIKQKGALQNTLPSAELDDALCKSDVDSINQCDLTERRLHREQQIADLGSAAIKQRLSRLRVNVFLRGCVVDLAVPNVPCRHQEDALVDLGWRTTSIVHNWPDESGQTSKLPMRRHLP